MVGRKRSVSWLPIASSPSEARSPSGISAHEPTVLPSPPNRYSRCVSRIWPLRGRAFSKKDSKIRSSWLPRAIDAHVLVAEGRDPGQRGVGDEGHPARGAEVLAQRRLERAHDARQVPRAEQPSRQLVHALGRQVVAAPVLDQLVQPLLEPALLLAQHEHLALDQRHCGAAALVRQAAAG